jgi:O-antigen ligase
MSQKAPLLAEAPASAPTPSGVSVRARGRNGKATLDDSDPSLHTAKLAFFFLLLFTGVLFGRPSDFFWSLQDIPIAQIVAILAVLAYAFTKLQGKAPLIMTRELKLVAVLTVLYTLGLPFAFWKQMTYDTLTKDWMKTVIIFLLITQTMFTMDRVRKLLWVVILCEFVVSGYSLVDPRTNITSAEGRMRGSTVGFLSGNYLGIAAATTLPYLAVFLVRSKKAVVSCLLASTFGLLMLLMVRTASRGSLISVVIALVLVWVVVLRHSMKARLMGFVFAGAIVVAMIFAPGVFWDRISTMWSTESYATSDDSRSAGESEFQRKALLRRSIQYTLENPLFGLGLGNFAIRSGSEYGAQDWKGTHNTYLQVGAESGIPAFILFFMLLFGAVGNMRRIIKNPGPGEAGEELQQMARATLVSLYAFMLSAVFAHLAYDFFLYYLIGIGVALQAIHQRHLERSGIPFSNGKSRRHPRNGALRPNGALPATR